MQSRLLGLTPWIALVGAIFAACSSPTQTTTIPSSGSSSGGVSSGTTSGSSTGTGGGSGASSGAGTGAASGASTGASASGGSGLSSGAGSGASTGTGSGASTGASTSGSGSGASSGSGGGIHSHAGSPGCGKAWTGATGQWVSQPAGCAAGNGNQGNASCQLIQGVSGWTAPGVVKQTPNPKTPSVETSDEQRGWWVLVPTGYDPNKPYRVIYGFAGCGDQNYFNAGNAGYDYHQVDNAQAIQVGLDYDTYSDVPGCYDNRNPTSNDFAFVPWLMNTIENEFCVDVNHQYVSGYSSGGWVAQQMNCAYPDKFRGMVSLTGCEPGAGVPGSQPPCVSNKPTAFMHVHDIGDNGNVYSCSIPGCARVLMQNGCSVTTCDPTNPALVTPYAVPAGVTLPNGSTCVSFNGCPADYPVVFCVLHGTSHADPQTSWGITRLFWDFMANHTAD